MDQRCGDITEELWGDKVGCFEKPTLEKPPGKVSVWFAIEEMIMVVLQSNLTFFCINIIPCHSTSTSTSLYFALSKQKLQ